MLWDGKVKDWDKLFTIKSWIEWMVVLQEGNNKIEITKKDLLSALKEWDVGDDFLEEIMGFFEETIQERFETESAEYDTLKPVWFEYAPDKVQRYWSTLEEKKDIEQMKHLKKILVYNDDKKTIGLPQIDEIFCYNLEPRRCFSVIIKSVESKWYNLLSDWNDWDSETDKEKTDCHRLITMFWKYVHAIPFMLNLDRKNNFWTKTKYKDKNWNEDFVLLRTGSDFSRDMNHTDWYHNAFGFKKKDSV